MRHDYKRTERDYNHDYGWTPERAKRLAAATNVAGDKASLQKSKRDLIALAEEIHEDIRKVPTSGEPFYNFSQLFLETMKAYFDACHKLRQLKA